MGMLEAPISLNRSRSLSFDKSSPVDDEVMTIPRSECFDHKEIKDVIEFDNSLQLSQLSVGELNDDDKQKDLDPDDPCNTDKDKEIEKASANPDDPCNTDEGNEIEKSSPVFDRCKSFMRSRSSRIGSVYSKISKSSRRSIIIDK